MWPTEYVIHEHRQNLERTAAEIRLAREASTQPTRWMTHVVKIMRMFRFRLRRRQPISQPSLALRRAS